MMDFLLFILPLSIAGNVALILTVIGDIKKERENEIRIRMLEADKPKLIEGLQRIQRAFETARNRRKK